MIAIMNLTAGRPDPYSGGVMDTRSRTLGAARQPLTAPAGRICTTRVVQLALLMTHIRLMG